MHFPKDVSCLRSHYNFIPRPVGFTGAGEPKGLSRLPFVRSFLTPYYLKEGGYCHDPATLFFSQSVHLNAYADYAAFFRELRQEDK